MDKVIKKQIYLNNSIFEDIRSMSLKNGNHMAFTYAYYGVISYLYRYCLWIEDKPITQADIKDMIGYNRTYKPIDYIVKKNGILDSYGYTETTRDIPVKWWLDDDNDVMFNYVSDYNDEYIKDVFKIPSRYTIKYPIKAFHIDNESYKDGDVNGTFYILDNTHSFDVNVMKKFLNNKQLGLNAFYLYQYLKMKCGQFDVYSDTLDNISSKLGLSERTIKEYSYKLEELGVISISRFDYNYDTKNRECNKYRIQTPV